MRHPLYMIVRRVVPDFQADDPAGSGGFYAEVVGLEPVMDLGWIAKRSLSEQLVARGKDPDRFPNALATMWTWISEDARDADRVLRDESESDRAVTFSPNSPKRQPLPDRSSHETARPRCSLALGW